MIYLGGTISTNLEAGFAMPYKVVGLLHSYTLSNNRKDAQ